MASPRKLPKMIELELIPKSPDTIDTVKQELMPRVREALRESGHEDLLARGEIVVEIEQTLTLQEELIAVGVTFLTKIAAKVFERDVLPVIEKWVKTRRKGRRQTKRTTH
jgi:hypothetical protein